MDTEVKQPSKFLQGLAKLPLVTSITEKLSEVYTRTKESNEFLKITMQIAENVVKCGAECAKPLVDKLEEDIDDLAYEQLKKLEANCPFIALPPAVILECSKFALEEVINYGLKTSDIVKSYYENFQQVKAYGWDKVFTITNYREKELNKSLKKDTPINFINGAVEMMPMTRRHLDIIPTPQCENSEITITESCYNKVKRLTVLSQTAHSRLRCAALDQLGELKSIADKIMEELKAVLYFLQENIATYTTNWQELDKDEKEKVYSSVQSTLLEKARLLTKMLTNVFKQATGMLTYLSTNEKQRFMEGTEEAYNLKNSFKWASIAGEITETVFEHAHENVQTLEKVIASYWNLRFLAVPNIYFLTTEK